MAVDTPTSVMANAVGAACKRLLGRGPEGIRVLFAGGDTVLVLLTGILTEAERTLLAGGHNGSVISQRAALHDALEPDVRVILETNIGRETHAFISGIDVDHDMASFVVTLH